MPNPNQHFYFLLIVVCLNTAHAQVYDTAGNQVYDFDIAAMRYVGESIETDRGFKLRNGANYRISHNSISINGTAHLEFTPSDLREFNQRPGYNYLFDEPSAEIIESQGRHTYFFKVITPEIKVPNEYGWTLLTIFEDKIINEFKETVYTFTSIPSAWMIFVIAHNYYKINYRGVAFEKIKERRKELGELNTNVVQLLAPESPAGTYAYFVQFGKEVITLSREQAAQLKNLWLDQEMGSKSFNPNQAKKKGVKTNYLAIRIYIRNKYKDEIRALAKTSSNNSVASEVREIPKEMSAKKVIDSYLSALGGAEVLREIKNSIIKSSYGGSKQEMTIIMEKPNKYKSIISAENYSYITVYDGINAYAKQNGKKISVPKKTKEWIKNSSLWPELNYFEDSNDIALKSIEKVNNEDCYILEITTSTSHP